MARDYVKLGDLEIYQLCLQLSREGWKVYKPLHWQDKKIMGDQFIESIDSVGANFAEGYGRYHYKDRAKFYYNARGSLFEAKHWSLLLYERGKIGKEKFDALISLSANIHKQLNSYISACLKTV